MRGVGSVWVSPRGLRIDCTYLTSIHTFSARYEQKKKALSEKEKEVEANRKEVKEAKEEVEIKRQRIANLNKDLTEMKEK